jgi:ABC-type polysaccharide/polyol phosphate transport system ATPase subunit
MAVIQVDDVSKRFRLYKERPGSVKEIFTKFGRAPSYDEFWALRNVSLDVEEASVHGLIGHNGCGKSTLLRVMAGIHKPTSGKVSTHGRISALLELGAGFHPELTGRENIYLNAAILGLSRKQTDGLFDGIVEFSGLSAFIDSPVKHYSSGMFVRLGFSVAVHVDPQILLIDEVIAVGDEEFQRRCLDHLASLRSQGVTIVLVTHAMAIVQNMCDHVTWMDHGVVRAQGPALEVVGDYLREVNDEEASRLPADTEGEIDVAAGAPAPTAPVKIEGFELLDGRGSLASFALSGEPMAIRVHWRASRPVDPPQLRLTIESEGGVALSTATLEPGNDVLPAVGRYYVDYGLDHFPLAPGNYIVKLVARDAGSHAELDRFTETALLVRSGGYAIEGMFDLRGSWGAIRLED